MPLSAYYQQCKKSRNQSCSRRRWRTAIPKQLENQVLINQKHNDNKKQQSVNTATTLAEVTGSTNWHFGPLIISRSPL